MTAPSTLIVTAAFAVGLATIAGLSAQPPGKGPPPGKGMGKDPAFVADRDTFHYLLTHHSEVRRTVKEIDGGVETVTESANPEVAAKLREHATAMHARVKAGKGIHYRDPLFAEIFRHYDKITMTVERTEKGVRVTETAADPYVVKLIRAHAAVVSKFVENGHTEVRKDHPLPDTPDPKKP